MLYHFNFLKKNDGIAVIEFGFTAPVFVVLVVAMFEFGMMYVAQNALDGAAREAARFGMTGAISNGDREESVNQLVRRVVEDLSGGIVDTGSARFSIEVAAYDALDLVGQPEPFIDENGDGEYTEGEFYEDINGNGVWDADQGVVGSFGVGGETANYIITYEWPTILHFMGLSEPIVLTGRTPVVNEVFP